MSEKNNITSVNEISTLFFTWVANHEQALFRYCRCFPQCCYTKDVLSAFDSSLLVEAMQEELNEYCRRLEGSKTLQKALVDPTLSSSAVEIGRNYFCQLDLATILLYACVSGIRLAYRIALNAVSKKDLSVSKRNRTSRTLVSEGFFDCSKQQFAVADHAGCQDTRRLARLETEYIALSACCAQSVDVITALPTMAFGFTLKFNAVLNLSGALIQPHGGRDISSLAILERVNCVLRISGLYTLRLLDAACKKVLNLLKKGLLKVEAILKSAWTEKDQIDNFLKERRLRRNLRKFVGGRLYEGDLRLRQ
ncbi:hypothetical protein Tco_1501506 [Tanacetum coccineum]